jgi:hypothetical protein
MPSEARRHSAPRSPQARIRSNVHQSSAATAPQPDNIPRCEHTPNRHLRGSRRRRGVPVPTVSPMHGSGATSTSPVWQQHPRPTTFPVASTHRTATCAVPAGGEASQCPQLAQGTVPEQRPPVQCGKSTPTRQHSPLRAHTEPPPALFPQEARRPSAPRSPKARFRSNVHQSNAATAPQPDNIPRCEHTPNRHLRGSRKRRGVPVPPVSPRQGSGATSTSPMRQQHPNPTTFPVASTSRTATARFPLEARRPSAHS